MPVVAWLIGCLTSLLGLTPSFTPQQIVDVSRPGGSGELQRLLLRPPVRRDATVPVASSSGLLRKLAGLASIKGEDLLLQASTDQQVKYQRLRASLPSRLWKWKTIAGWSWTGSSEHINVFELRAVYTTIRWWATMRKVSSSRMHGAFDGLPCLSTCAQSRAQQQPKNAKDHSKIEQLPLGVQPSSGMGLREHRRQSGRSAESAQGQEMMGKVGRRHREGRTKQERIAVRKKKCLLQTLTVQTRTKVRYEAAREQFYAFLRANNLSCPGRFRNLTLWCQNLLNTCGQLEKGDQSP